jgi:hypothetical protein
MPSFDAPWLLPVALFVPPPEVVVAGLAVVGLFVVAFVFPAVAFAAGVVVPALDGEGLFVEGVVELPVVDEHVGIEAAPSTAAANPLLSELFSDRLCPEYTSWTTKTRFPSFS